MGFLVNNGGFCEIRKVSVLMTTCGVVLAALISVHWFFPADLWAQQSSVLSVEVRTAKLRSAPRTWAPAIADLSYGEELRVLGREDGWVRAQKGDREGYVHETALTTRAVILAAGTRVVDPTAEGGQIVLAGKGFAEAVELQVSTRDPSLNFTAVDALERFTVQGDELEAFLVAGRLHQTPKGRS